MNVSYDLEPFTDEIRDAYLKLLPEQEQAIASGKLDWKFSRNPAGAGTVAVARGDGDIIGVNAFMRSSFGLRGHPVRAYQSMDTIVMPAARGKGVFPGLLNCFYERTDGTLIYGFPNVNSSPGFFGKLGWTYFSPVPMLFRPLRTGYFLKRFGRLMPDIRVPVLARPHRSAERIESFDDSATDMWRRFARGIECAVERDADYLNWRLRDHPSEKYDILRSPDGSFTVHSTSDKHGGRIGYLMEAIGTPDSLPPLIASSLRQIAASGADAALAWCLPGSPNYSAYRKAGFYPLPTKLRSILINFGARPLRADPEASAAIVDPAGWYISYLDSDTV
ncbi:MAG TPA: GNAT family N-acetyltransferase [Allosphingosinicella sp.]|jgi:hypothetical protein